LEGLLRDREAIAVSSAADMLDQIQHASERDMAMRLFERETQTLVEVRAALDRITLGTYGICLDCEEDISPKRLAALPWTASCLACREAADRSRTLPDGLAEEALIDRD
jgi:DnaK suppressor protein